MRATDESCILATHIDPAWDAPRGYQEAVASYIEETDVDSFVYVSNPDRDEGTWEEKADIVMQASEGFLQEDDRDTLLDQYTTIHHIGAYYEACHGNTWQSLVDGIYKDAREESYEIHFPTDCVTDVGETLKEKVSKDPPSLLTSELTDVDDVVEFELTYYQRSGASFAEEDDTITYDVGPDKNMITWHLESR